MDKSNKPATEALNEEDYINKLYDSARDKQKQLLMDAYTGNLDVLDEEQNRAQKQAETNIGRTDVEAEALSQAYNPQNTSDGINAQVELAMGNQQRKNVGTIREAQSEAYYEIERQRQLLGQQYAEAIKKAQAENDYARAQQLYAEAKEKEAMFRALREDAAKLMATKGDNSILEELAAGITAAYGNGEESNPVVFQNEEEINRIYNSANEANRAEAQMLLNAMLSKLQAENDTASRVTDRRLTETYVDALKRGKNYDEVQTASGLGSGNMAQAQLARMLGTTEDLTALRTAQMGTDAGIGQQRFEGYQMYRDAVQQSEAENEQNRIDALYKAAKKEEQNLVDAQKELGKTLAKQGDYSVLAKLYGLTQEQIDRLMGKKGDNQPRQPQAEPPAEAEAPETTKEDEIWNRGSEYSGVGAAEEKESTAQERKKEQEKLAKLLAQELMWARNS